jgi:hypothetical protein
VVLREYDSLASSRPLPTSSILRHYRERFRTIKRSSKAISLTFDLASRGGQWIGLIVFDERFFAELEEGRVVFSDDSFGFV